ncbi:MAG: BON domain-containing protein [Nitrospirota bacterium]
MENIMITGSEKIKKNVKERLQWDSRVDGAEIIIMVSNGEVILSGVVPTYSAFQAAQMDASVVPGVDKVTNNISVRCRKEITDKELETRINNMFQWSADIDSSMIKISAQDGRVKLQGPVKSYWEKVKVQEVVSNAECVTEIENDLFVTPRVQFEDKVISDNIIHALDKNIYIDPYVVKVYVKVESGKVTLSGNVPTWAARDAILNIAFYTPGVSDVEDNLNIGFSYKL